MKSLKEKLLETLYIKESNIDDDLYNAALCIPETEIVFKILCALGFGSENDDYINLTIKSLHYEDYIICKPIRDGEIQSVKKLTNILDKILENTNYYCSDEKTKSKYSSCSTYYIHIKNRETYDIIFTIQVTVVGQSRYDRLTYGKSKSSISDQIYFGGKIWSKYYSIGSYQVDSEYNNRIFAGGFWREIHKDTKDTVVVIPNIKKFKTPEEYKALIELSAKKHNNDENYQKAINDLCYSIVKNADKTELDKVIKAYLRK